MSILIKKVLIIPDGHRRYANLHSIDYESSYILGAETAAELVKECLYSKTVTHLAFFPLASKNFKERNCSNLSFIFSALKKFIVSVEPVLGNNINIKYRGSLNRLPKDEKKMIEKLVKNKCCKNEPQMTLELLIDYDGAEELRNLSSIEIEKKLSFPFDIVVRTGGSFRLSGSPVECLEADMFCLDVMFPDIRFNHLLKIFNKYNDDKDRRALLRGKNNISHNVF